MSRRLFLDTNVFAAAFADKDGAARGLVDAGAAGLMTVVISERLMKELTGLYRRLFGREEASRVRAALLLFPSILIVDRISWEMTLPVVSPFVRDRSDAPHFAAARSARVAAFVSYNRRSILPQMFDLVPLATPEAIIESVVGGAAWPSRRTLLDSWEEWARRSPRAP